MYSKIKLRGCKANCLIQSSLMKHTSPLRASRQPLLSPLVQIILNQIRRSTFRGVLLYNNFSEYLVNIIVVTEVQSHASHVSECTPNLKVDLLPRKCFNSKKHVNQKFGIFAKPRVKDYSGGGGDYLIQKVISRSCHSLTAILRLYYVVRWSETFLRALIIPSLFA